MLVMIFVNDLAGVKGLPWWTYHLPAKVDGMTYVDWVFPGFLFAVGMSLPLAVARRLQKGASPGRIWLHVVTRSLSLAVLGLILANVSKLDPGLAGVSAKTWILTALLGAFLLWGVYPGTLESPRLRAGLKIAGLVLIAGALALFRRKGHDGTPAWLDVSYWEILGLIGWSYFAVCLLYIPLRKLRWAPAALFVLFCGMNALAKIGWLNWLRRLPIYLWPFGNGALPSIIAAGAVVAGVFLCAGKERTIKEKVLRSLGFTAAVFVAGWILAPLGISKIRATPTWCLYSSGISTLLFLALYWIADVRRRTGWAWLIKPAGSNTLMTYLLPDVFYFIMGFAYVPAFFSQGLPGAAKSFVFTCFILVCSAALTRMRFRMQL